MALRKPTRIRTRQRGFTLSELMVSIAIMGFVIGGMYSFYMTFYKMGFVNEQKNMINADMRSITGKLTEDGRQANYFLLYESSSLTDRDDVGDRLTDGNSGDFILFVYTEEGEARLGQDKISRLVGYYRDTSNEDLDGRAPVRAFDLSFDPAREQDVESLIPIGDSLDISRSVLELSRGLSDGRLFHNFWGRSVMVNAQIFHGNEAKRVTETYNFTISPRG